MSDQRHTNDGIAVTNEDTAARRLSAEELALEGGELLPDKEVLSILDLFVNIDLALDLAAPVDLAVAANANVAAPIDAAATANVLTIGSSATALAQQGVLIDQHISGEAIASAPQQAVIDQGNDVVDDGGSGGDSTSPTGAREADQGTGGEVAGTGATTTDVVDGTGNGVLDGPLLNVNVNAQLDADLAAPVAGAVAVNGNVAAPIDAAVAANVGTIDSSSTAIADQTAIINQSMEDVSASATADQEAEITQ